MAFSNRNLAVLAYCNGFTLWHYKAVGDTLNQISALGFFNDAGDMLTAGDMVIVSGEEGGRVLCVVPDPRQVRTVPLA